MALSQYKSLLKYVEKVVSPQLKIYFKRTTKLIKHKQNENAHFRKKDVLGAPLLTCLNISKTIIKIWQINSFPYNLGRKKGTLATYGSKKILLLI